MQLSSKKFGSIIAASCLTAYTVGAYAGMSYHGQSVTQSVAPAPTPIIKTVAASCPSATSLRDQLKAVDDQIIANGAAGIAAQSDSLSIAGEIIPQLAAGTASLDEINADNARIQANNATLNQLTAQVKQLTVQRQQVLSTQ